MTKIAINARYGGFGLSELAARRLAALGNKEMIRALNRFDNPSSDRLGQFTALLGFSGHIHETPRNDSALLSVIEELGDAANSKFARIVIIEIPDDVEWEIEEYDGIEWVSEKHRTWR